MRPKEALALLNFHWDDAYVRHEAPFKPSGGERTPPLLCRSSVAKLRAA
jgi:hypothetical protein